MWYKVLVHEDHYLDMLSSDEWAAQCSGYAVSNVKVESPSLGAQAFEVWVKLPDGDDPTKIDEVVWHGFKEYMSEYGIPYVITGVHKPDECFALGR